MEEIGRVVLAYLKKKKAQNREKEKPVTNTGSLGNRTTGPSNGPQDSLPGTDSYQVRYKLIKEVNEAIVRINSDGLRVKISL